MSILSTHSITLCLLGCFSIPLGIIKEERSILCLLMRFKVGTVVRPCVHVEVLVKAYISAEWSVWVQFNSPV